MENFWGSDMLSQDPKFFTIFVPAGDVRVAPLILVDLIPIWSAGKNAMV
jgi:hypothetical protein